MRKIVIASKTHGKKVVFVDDEDYGWLIQYNWHISKAHNPYNGKELFYAKRWKPLGKGKRLHVCMHREIMGITDPKIEIDHINHNGLHNFKTNLRVCTSANNKWNRSKQGTVSTSKYIGVSLRKRKNKNGIYLCWIACLNIKGVKNPKRHFPYNKKGEVEAAKFYDEQAAKAYGQFANLNFKDK